MKRVVMLRKGQMQLSFGMIFSIFLIIIFLAFAFYAISKVLSTGDLVSIRSEISSLQKQVDEMYRASGGGYETKGSYSFPKKVEEICFIDYECDGTNCVRGRGNRNIYSEMEFYRGEANNLFFYPIGSSEGVDSTKINNIDIEAITASENPYCIKNVGGVEVYLKRVSGNPFVIIERV